MKKERLIRLIKHGDTNKIRLRNIEVLVTPEECFDIIITNEDYRNSITHYHFIFQNKNDCPLGYQFETVEQLRRELWKDIVKNGLEYLLPDRSFIANAELINQARRDNTIKLLIFKHSDYNAGGEIIDSTQPKKYIVPPQIWKDVIVI